MVGTGIHIDSVEAAFRKTAIGMIVVGKEISRRATRSREIGDAAVDNTRAADSVMSRLTEEVGRIDEIVELINTVAKQTNLLALDATIESARAGAAGKGFAVVATEVKHLADQTAKATDEIRGIRNSTANAASAVREARARIGEMSEITRSLVAAVDQQDEATREIARGIRSAADGTDEVGRGMTPLSAPSAASGRAAGLRLGVEAFANENSRDPRRPGGLDRRGGERP